MILAAERENCLAEVLIIAAVLEVDDPRERPFERAEAADRAHEQFHDERSDFLSLLKLWELLRGGGRAPEIEPQAGAGAARAVPLAAPAARMARRAPPARRAGGRDAHARQPEARDLRAGAPRAHRRAARQRRHQGRGGRRVSRRARHQVLDLSRARGCARSSRTGCWRPSWSRRRGSTRAASRASSPNGWRPSPATS